MKELYWTRRKVPRHAVLLVALLTCLSVAAVELFRQQVRQPNYATKLAATELALKAMQCLRQERERRGYPVDLTVDPAGTGLVGAEVTPVTSIAGHLGAKQASVNPNFAAVAVEMLAEAGVQSGDVVAVGCSGSFPAINTCVFAALETLEARPIVISSVTSSQYGANLPDFMWLDMERVLSDQERISFRSVAASRGGYEDRAIGMSEDSRRLLEQVVSRNQLPLIDADSFTDSVDQRMALYRQYAETATIQAYINGGGGTVCVGRSLGKKLIRPGLNLRPPTGSGDVDGVMYRFVRQQTPVLHFGQINALCQQYGLKTPQDRLAEVGASNVFVRRDYNRWLAGATFLLIVGVITVFAHRVSKAPAASDTAEIPAATGLEETKAASAGF